ncbi:DUF7504 family protein [Halopenitus persicus]|uniref:DUF7504 family protein n=1 Tax=Halopenitus persicus TaxID=1048396 RepID=UPI000BBA53B0|nr:hypothetical protein [Halopenitus persicus]
MSDDSNGTDDPDHDGTSDSTSDGSTAREDDAGRRGSRFRDLRTKVQNGESVTDEPTSAEPTSGAERTTESESTAASESTIESDPERRVDDPATDADAGRGADDEEEWEWFQGDAPPEEERLTGGGHTAGTAGKGPGADSPVDDEDDAATGSGAPEPQRESEADVAGPETDDRLWNAADSNTDDDHATGTDLGVASEADAPDAESDPPDAESDPPDAESDPPDAESTTDSASAVDAAESEPSSRDGITIDPVEEDTAEPSDTAEPTTGSNEHDRTDDAPDAGTPDERAGSSKRSGRLWSDPTAVAGRSTSDRESPADAPSDRNSAESGAANAGTPSDPTASDGVDSGEELESTTGTPSSGDPEVWDGTDHEADAGPAAPESDAEAADLPAFDVLDPGSNALVLDSLSGPVSETACGRLLDAGDAGTPAGASDARNVLIVAIEEPAAERIDVCHRAGIDAGEIAAIEVGSHGGPRSVASETTGGGQSVSLTRVSKPSNLSKLGILITKQLSEWETDDRPVVFCLHSLTALQQYVSDEKLFRFLHVLTRRLSASGGRAHFHMDPDAHHEMVVGTLRPIFDVIVRIGPDGTVDVEHE